MWPENGRIVDDRFVFSGLLVDSVDVVAAWVHHVHPVHSIHQQLPKKLNSLDKVNIMT